jgi:DNA-binding response OmpR family regulator
MTTMVSSPISKMRIAVVEDDPLLRQEIVLHLEKIGFTAFELNNGKGLDDLLSSEIIDALILDLNLPGEGGLSIAKRIRLIYPKMGIIMLTARSALIDRLKGYESGADVYLSKPIASEELVATLLSLNNRITNQNKQDTWTLDLPNRQLLGKETWQKVSLTNHERMVLLYLIQAKDQTASSEALCSLLNFKEEDAKKHSLESMLSRLRKKIASIANLDNEMAIKSIWGEGYQLCLKVAIYS